MFLLVENYNLTAPYYYGFMLLILREFLEFFFLDLTLLEGHYQFFYVKMNTVRALYLK